MNELLRVTYDNDRITVSARELHKFLEATERFGSWFDRMRQYGMTEGEDFTGVKSFTVVNNGAQRELQDYQLTIECAKEICMLQRNDKGKMARQYFIQLEKDWNSPDKVMARALLMANRRLEAQDRRIEEMRPKEIFADAVSASKTSILVGELAKLISQNGVDIGQKRMFNWLRENGYLIKGKHRSDYNMPTQRSMEMDLFEIKESTVAHSDGRITLNKTVKVTGKGQQYFVNKFLADRR